MAGSAPPGGLRRRMAMPPWQHVQGRPLGSSRPRYPTLASQAPRPLVGPPQRQPQLHRPTRALQAPRPLVGPPLPRRTLLRHAALGPSPPISGRPADVPQDGSHESPALATVLSRLGLTVPPAATRQATQAPCRRLPSHTPLGAVVGRLYTSAVQLSAHTRPLSSHAVLTPPLLPAPTLRSVTLPHTAHCRTATPCR